MNTFTGGCLCGDVQYEGREPQGGGHCFCVDCRRSSGTSHCSHMMVAESALSVQGELRFFNGPADSGNNVSRGFCPRCGSAVLSKNSAMPGMSFIRASSLDDPSVFTPQMSVYVSRAAVWSQPDPALPSFPEMPPPPDMPEGIRESAGE